MVRILIAEDNPAEAVLIRDFCNHLDFESTVVEDGWAMLEAIRSSPPDLILMDINTPVFDGLASTIEIRGLQNVSDQMMIIGLNGNSPMLSAACRVAGMNQIIPAPLQPERLIAALRAVQAPLNFQANTTEPEHGTRRPEDDETVMQRMAETFGPMPAEIPFARLYYTNSQKLHGHFGSAWPEISARIEAVTRSVIERQLGESAAYKRFDELDFVLMTPGLAEAACIAKCQFVVKEICCHLANDEVGAKFRVRTVVFKAKPAPPASCAAEPGAYFDPARLANPDILPWTRLIFWPVWDTQRRKFPIHTIRVARDADGALLPEAVLAMQQGGQGNYLESLDISAIADVIGRLDGYETLEQPRLLTIPLHLKTLENFAARARCLRYLELIPKKIRERLVIEIHDIPNEIRAAQIAEYQKPMLAHCLHTMLLVSPQYRNFSVLKQISNQIVGVQLSDAEPEIQQELAALKQFGALAKQSGLTMAASLVRTGPFQDWGLTSCRYVLGPSVAAPQTTLNPGAKFIS